jgi:hypothetical protein
LSLGLAVLAAAGLMLVLGAGDRLWHLAAGALEDAPVLFRHALRELRRIPAWVVAGTVVVLIVAFLLVRTVRA